ncbi:MerR family transcriptional regulator [Anaerotignum sp. MSJ-24]|uniref:MerR family transcriptional regulator n=1 Tax=Anaerotignum sp. MSJ-24 TaxID=2841521 RepID=UPI001C0F7984|nr:MerR family transcriptional regulator [Anaerotignum sp. MSJ-24]MBD9218822.1 MerR family transcriptional regulator [Clostridiales bacterium]MBU5464937.1 MerR family transcriptional regulator [Anaerotignum sp. MSJ-24]
MTIAEVSKQYNISADTLRYYERIGLIPPVNRNKNGIRDYTDEDCKWVDFIKCMRSAGLPIEVLIEYVTLFRQGNSTIEARKEILIEQRGILEEKINFMTATLERLNYKIDNYDTIILSAENRLTEK